jgi:protease YdgD
LGVGGKLIGGEAACRTRPRLRVNGSAGRWDGAAGIVGSMQRHLGRLLACLAGVLGAGGVSAQDLRPGIIGTDDRVTVTEDGAPWDAIGQVNVSSYRTKTACTGTLVAPDMVLTAAHCVVDRRTRLPFPPHTIHFVAGVRRGQNLGHSTARCLRFRQDFGAAVPELAGSTRAVPKVTSGALLTDVVVIILNDRMSIETAALSDAEPSLDAPLLHAAYPADRRFVLSAHDNCHRVPSGEAPPLWFTDCDTHPASSGGPIFAKTPGGLQLAAIMIATGAHQANIALPISEWRALLQTGECP